LAAGGAQSAAQAGKPGPGGIERRGRKRIAEGGYCGAKRMLWFMAKYANGISEKKRLGIRFLTIVPQQMILGTGVGDAGANAYAHAMGMKQEEFVARFGAPMPPRQFGDKVVSVLEDPEYAEGLAFGLKGGAGVTMLEAAA
jgi:hypothetical protein